MLLGGEQLSREHQAEIADRFEAYLDGRAASLDEAFAVKPAAGERTWRTQTALVTRDELICAAAAQFFPTITPLAQAEKLAEALRRYHSAAWLRERELDECDPRHAGKLPEVLWRILKAHEHPVGCRRIRFILAASSVYSRPTL